MAKHSRLSLLGVTLVTPVLTAANSPASALVLPTNTQQADRAGDPDAAATSSRLKAEILALTPSQKLGIAGDRVPLLQVRTVEPYSDILLAGVHRPTPVIACGTSVMLNQQSKVIKQPAVMRWTAPSPGCVPRACPTSPTHETAALHNQAGHGKVTTRQAPTARGCAATC
jgi:hypothetical protein